MIITAIIYGVCGLLLGLCIGAILAFRYAENSVVEEFREGIKKIMKILNEIDTETVRMQVALLCQYESVIIQGMGEKILIVVKGLGSFEGANMPIAVAKAYKVMLLANTTDNEEKEE